MNKKLTTSQLAKAGLFIALSIVLSRLFSIQLTPVLRIGFGQLPIMLAGIVINPIMGLIVGALADIIGYLMNPMGGGFIPGITISAALIGFIPGVFYHYILKNKRKAAIYVGVAVSCLAVNAVLTTFWLSLAFSSYSFVAAFPMRLVNQLIMIPINIILLLGLLKLPIFINKSK